MHKNIHQKAASSYCLACTSSSSTVKVRSPPCVVVRGWGSWPLSYSESFQYWSDLVVLAKLVPLTRIPENWHFFNSLVSRSPQPDLVQTHG